ncbi:MAG: hypothetical protein ACM31C_14295 [Acidobacteriota bacterium]
MRLQLAPPPSALVAPPEDVHELVGFALPAAAGGAHVTWLPFDGGHELPLVVWRGLRKFLRAVP